MEILSCVFNEIGYISSGMTLADNFLNNFLRNHNPPYLLDLPRSGGGGIDGIRGTRQIVNQPGDNHNNCLVQ